MDKKLKLIVEKWLIKADGDLKTSENEITAKEPVTDSICFHCQQAVEKYLKAFLISQGKEPIKTHNIYLLLEECENIDSDFSSLRGIEYLNEYAVTLRYPDEFYTTTLSESLKALEDAKRVRAFVLERLK